MAILLIPATSTSISQAGGSVSTTAAGAITLAPLAGQNTTVSSGQLILPTGTAAPPALVGPDTDTGVWFRSANQVALSANGGSVLGVTGSTLVNIASGATFGWGSVDSATVDVTMARTGVGSVALGGQPNGQLLGIKTLTELRTIAAAANTDTTIQIPANALAVAVSVRVTTVIPTAATFDVGIAGATTRYGTGLLVAAGTTNPGTNDGVRFYSAATAIRITPNLTPGAATGVVRVTIHYLDATPATS